MYFDKKNQIERLEMKIDTNKAEAARHLAFLGGSMAVVAIGSFGTIHFGSSLIEAMQNGQAITYGSLVLSKFQESALGLSILGTFCGAVGTIHNGRESYGDLKRINDYKEKIKNLELESEEENNHTKRLG